MKIIEFKSNMEFYWKEKTGIKNNTVRKIDTTDERLELINDYINGNVKRLMIKITLSENPEEYFEREIKDISIFDGYYILTFLIGESHKLADYYIEFDHTMPLNKLRIDGQYIFYNKDLPWKGCSHKKIMRHAVELSNRLKKDGQLSGEIEII